MGILRKLVEMLPSSEHDGITRYHILRDSPLANVFVHRITACEMGDLCHNHPWNLSISFVVKGAYLEETFIDGRRCQRVRTRFSIAMLTHDMFHRVVGAEEDTWTLFLTVGRRDAGWGYANEFGFWPKSSKSDA